jgi:uncharacterized protein (TIGR02453 family)
MERKMIENFNGFPPEAIRFFQELALNNSKPWFEDNRVLFEEKVLTPARLLVEELGERLRGIAPDLVADPRIDKSIFRLHRDTRFSPDKSPYKTHLGIFLWEGRRPKIENSGFYLQINPDSVELGAGIYLFPNDALPVFREAVVSPRGESLAKIVADIRQRGKLEMCAPHFKKVPRGFAADHPNAEFLRYNGLFAMAQREIPPAFYSAEFIDFCFEYFLETTALHAWIRDLMDHA